MAYLVCSVYTHTYCILVYTPNQPLGLGLACCVKMFLVLSCLTLSLTLLLSFKGVQARPKSGPGAMK